MIYSSLYPIAMEHGRQCNMQRFYILLSDELGESFGVYMYASDLDSCLDKLAYEYPESVVLDVKAHRLAPSDP